MSLFNDAGNIPVADMVRPGQFDQTGDLNAAAVIEYNTTVEHTIARASKLSGMIPMRSVRGTNKIGSYGFGKSTVQKLSVGEAPPSTPIDIGRNTLTVDTVVLTRHALPMLEVFQTSYDARRELGIEDGIEIAKFVDQSFFIQAAKAAMLTDSAYSGTANKPSGMFGGNIETLTNAADRFDPSKLYQALRNIFVKFEEKDVVPQMDDLLVALQPAEFYALQDAEQIVNGNYLTAQGHQLTGVPIFKAFGCPVVSSNNIPKTVIAGHHLSNANNGNAYDGDFTKLVGLVFSAKALLAGETIPLESDIFFDKILKSWFVDSHMSYGVTPDRAEYAGAILLP